VAGDAPMPQVRAVATSRLRRIAARLKAPALTDAQAAHAQLVQADIARFLARPFPPARPSTAPRVPPGAPIGSASWGSVDDDWCAMSPAGRPAAFFAPLITMPSRQ
jgi:hypothetical protein